tara:strand:- start:428 stop:769 length:342 start_codon:yes stop_codon:yes gene_type:complete
LSKYKAYENELNLIFFELNNINYEKYEKYHNFVKIKNNIIWKNKLFTGNIILLYYLDKYRDYDILLLGFNNSNLFFNKHNSNLNNTKHNIDKNVEFLNFIIKNYNNVKILNSF